MEMITCKFCGDSFPSFDVAHVCSKGRYAPVLPDPVREAFERVSAPSFGHELTFPKNTKGEYVDPVLEDHWQTFQEGWELAIEFLKNKSNSCYTDLVSNGGMDPRG